MGPRQRTQGLGHEVHDARLGQDPLLLQHLAQRRPLQVLHDNVEQLVFLAEVQDGHAVRVVDARGGQGLPAEALGGVGLLHHGRVEDLDRDPTVQGRMHRLIDLAHGPPADALADGILAIGQLSVSQGG